MDHVPAKVALLVHSVMLVIQDCLEIIVTFALLDTINKTTFAKVIKTVPKINYFSVI